MNPIHIIQTIVSVLLIVVILLQSQSGGLGAAFGGSNTFHTKRGMEKSLFVITIILAVVFTLTSIASLII